MNWLRLRLLLLCAWLSGKLGAQVIMLNQDAGEIGNNGAKHLLESPAMQQQFAQLAQVEMNCMLSAMSGQMFNPATWEGMRDALLGFMVENGCVRAVYSLEKMQEILEAGGFGKEPSDRYWEVVRMFTLTRANRGPKAPAVLMSGEPMRGKIH